MNILYGDGKILDVVCALLKGLTINALINCLLATPFAVVTKPMVAIYGIKDQMKLINEAIEKGDPVEIGIRVVQLITMVFGIMTQCFTGDTLVETDEGMIAIEDIEVGDYVLAEDTVTGEQEYKEVIDVHVTQTTKLVHVVTEDSDDNILFQSSEESTTTINTTDNHPFYVESKGWVPAIELEAGDILRTADGDVEVVKEVYVENLDEPVLIYNLEIEGYHTYYVSDENVLVHNTKKCGSNNKDEGVNTDVQNEIDKLPNSVKRYGNCDKFASKLAKSLDAKNIEYKIIKVESNYGIYSEKANMSIGLGFHYGIQVGNTVYDNMTIKGMSVDDWLVDLGLTGEFSSLSWTYVDDILE